MDKKPFYADFIEKTQRRKNFTSKKIEKTSLEKRKKEEKRNHKDANITIERKIQNSRKTLCKNIEIKIEKKLLFKRLTKEEYDLINSFLQFVDPVLNLSKKQKDETYRNIRKLFHHLTDERTDRSYDYLNNPRDLSSYIYYYLWWNLYRLVSLFNSIKFNLKDGSIVGDFGSGPLTSVLALWISKPELRNKEITFYCVDISSKVMKLGEDIFHSLCKFTSEENTKWKIKKLQASFPISLKTKLSLFISCNMFNEILWNKQNNLREKIRNYANTIDSYLEDDGSFIVVEPGLPIGGAIISLFRKSFLEKRYSVESPCPHIEHCPLHEKSVDNIPSAKNKWCHFSFSTFQAPSNLIQLSDRVGLNKKIVSLSYIYCIKNGKKEKNNNSSFSAIITSNIIKLEHNKIGRYACSGNGFLLLEGEEESIVRDLHFGSYISIPFHIFDKSFRDAKTGAIIIRI